MLVTVGSSHSLKGHDARNLTGIPFAHRMPIPKSSYRYKTPITTFSASFNKKTLNNCAEEFPQDRVDKIPNA
jgi:hypothetical protein